MNASTSYSIETLEASWTALVATEEDSRAVISSKLIYEALRDFRYNVMMLC